MFINKINYKEYPFMMIHNHYNHQNDFISYVLQTNLKQVNYNNMNIII